MKKIKFLFKALLRMDYKSFFKITKKVAKKSKRLYLITLIDIIYCGIKYQAGYMDYQEFEFYNLNNKQRETYLTRGKNNYIVNKYNNKEYWHYLSNKLEFNEKFKKYLKRDYIDLTKASAKDFEKFINDKEYVIAKEVDNCGGLGISKIKVKDYNSKILYNKLIENKQYLVEEMIKQNSKINKLYANSVNTIRLFTFNDGKNVHIINSIFRIGNSGFVDNFSSGGMYTFLDNNGKVIVPAIDKEDNKIDIHPTSKEKIVGFVVPNYDKAKQMVKEAAKEISEIKYIGWDVAITENDACLVEGNEFPGVFQIKPSFKKDAEGLIPTYKKYIKF